MGFKSILLTFVAVLLATHSAYACPIVDTLIDFNCDRVEKIAFTGDSFVKGVGDKRNPGGGYVSRVQEYYNTSSVVSFPKPGIHTGGLYSELLRKVPRMDSGDPARNLRNSDILILDVGRNDFWVDNNPPRTVNNIKRIVAFLRTELSKHGEIAPVIAVATLAPTNRGFQRSFITEVNRLLLKQRSEKLPVYVRFDKLRKSLLSSDGLHPKAVGYTQMASYIEDYIQGRGQERAQDARPDGDGDGIFDKFESLFGTNPNIADSDADGYSDGDEVFVYSTNPLDGASHP